MGKLYTCAECGGEFESDWTEEEAQAERLALFGDVPEEDMEQVCDDCFRDLGFGGEPS